MRAVDDPSEVDPLDEICTEVVLLLKEKGLDVNLAIGVVSGVVTKLALMVPPGEREEFITQTQESIRRTAEINDVVPRRSSSSARSRCDLGIGAIAGCVAKMAVQGYIAGNVFAPDAAAARKNFVHHPRNTFSTASVTCRLAQCRQTSAPARTIVPLQPSL